MINHLLGKDQDKFNKVATHIAQGLDPSNSQKLSKNLATLIIDESQTTRQISLALLLSSCTENNAARNILVDNNYSERRRETTVANINASNCQRWKAAKKRGDRTLFERTVPEAIVEFTNPLSDHTTIFFY